MKKTVLKMLSVLLALLIATAAMPAFAAGEDEIFVAGTIISESGYWKTQNGALTAGTEQDFNVSYDSASRTLTLKNAKLSSADLAGFIYSSDTLHAVIAAVNELKVNLEGKNELTVKEGKSSDSMGYGIVSDAGDIYISGGELDVVLAGGAERVAFYAVNNKISINSSKVKIISAGKTSPLSVGIGAMLAELENAEYTVALSDCDIAVGILAIPENALAKISNSKIDMDLDCSGISNGINIYGTEITGSDIDIDTYNSRNQSLGIFSFYFSCETSNVDIKLSQSSAQKSAVSYNRAYINGGKHQIATGSSNAVITPDSVKYNVIYINSFKSVYNPVEGIYGGYFKADGSISNGTKNNWNISYDEASNVLTLKDAKLDQSMRILGSADIVLKGDSVIKDNANYALVSDTNQSFSGSGSLTLISDNMAFYCKDTIAFGNGVVVTASTSLDGSNPVSFNAADAAGYKWIKIQGTDEPEDEPVKKSFWQKIIDFFKSIGDFFKGLFK